MRPEPGAGCFERELELKRSKRLFWTIFFAHVSLLG